LISVSASMTCKVGGAGLPCLAAAPGGIAHGNGDLPWRVVTEVGALAAAGPHVGLDRLGTLTAPLRTYCR
jgi:hypothetical protein